MANPPAEMRAARKPKWSVGSAILWERASIAFRGLGTRPQLLRCVFHHLKELNHSALSGYGKTTGGVSTLSRASRLSRICTSCYPCSRAARSLTHRL